jgi:hypothetical protein
LQTPEQHSTDALQGPKGDGMQLHTGLPPLPASGVSQTRAFSPGLMGAPILFPPDDTQTFG